MHCILPMHFVFFATEWKIILSYTLPYTTEYTFKKNLLRLSVVSWVDQSSKGTLVDYRWGLKISTV